MAMQPNDATNRPWEQLISNDDLKRQTGKDWGDWFRFLDEVSAGDRSHEQIVALLVASGELPTDLEAAEADTRFPVHLHQTVRWATPIATGYQQFLGLSVPEQHQRRGRTMVRTTLKATLDELFALWLAAVKSAEAFNGVSLEEAPSTTTNENRRFWRAALVDGSKVHVSVTRKSADETLISLDHFNIEDRDAARVWGVFWNEQVFRPLMMPFILRLGL